MKVEDGGMRGEGRGWRDEAEDADICVYPCVYVFVIWEKRSQKQKMQVCVDAGVCGCRCVWMQVCVCCSHVTCCSNNLISH